MIVAVTLIAWQAASATYGVARHLLSVLKILRSEQKKEDAPIIEIDAPRRVYFRIANEDSSALRNSTFASAFGEIVVSALDTSDPCLQSSVRILDLTLNSRYAKFPIAADKWTFCEFLEFKQVLNCVSYVFLCGVWRIYIAYLYWEYIVNVNLFGTLMLIILKLVQIAVHLALVDAWMPEVDYLDYLHSLGVM